MNKRTIFFSLIVLFISFSAIASINEKLSSTTQLFIAERDGRISLDIEMPGPKMMTRAPLLRTAPIERVIARAEPVNGVQMVPAFVHINPQNTSKIEALGVIVQERFEKFVTALIPVDKIERIAEIHDVNLVNVAKMVKHCSDKARYYTNTDDILNYSADAVSAGIPKTFKGSGVVIGVIDTGIDFQHKMFKDASGNSRIKLAYIANGNSLKAYTSITSSSPTTDNNQESHGTHTSSIAAGSNITFGGITYGGMATEANLVLVGLGEYLTHTNIANGIKKIFDYADSQNMPAVCSISLGTHEGPHDGTGDLASVFSDYAGSHSNHIIVVCAGNEAGITDGPVYCGGTSSSSSQFTTVLNGMAGSSLNNQYDGMDIFYARKASVQLYCKLHIVNTVDKSIVWTSSAITSSTYNVSGITSYFNKSPEVIIDQDRYSNKYYVSLYFDEMTKKSSYNDKKYALAITVYPKSGSCGIDAWDVNGCNGFGSMAGTIDDYNFCAGSDDVSIIDEACSNAVISVGSYCSKKTVTDYTGTSHSYSKYTINDIAPFSSYKVAGSGPNTAIKPDICAPGATVIAGINHYDSDFMANEYTKTGGYLVSKNGSSSLGSMSGTSMATPCVAGIIALYLQAAKQYGQTLNTSGVRTLFSKTAIKDSYTTKKNFGKYGKIDALAGLKYICPSLTVSPVILKFGTVVKGDAPTKTFIVTGTNLTGSLTVSSNNSNFTVSPTTITAAQAKAGATVTITYKPSATGTHSGTITIKGGGALSKTVSVSGKCVVPAITTSVSSLAFGQAGKGDQIKKTFTVTGTDLTGSLTVSSSNSNFTVSPTTITVAQAKAGATVTVTYKPSATGTHTGTITIKGGRATSKTVSVSGKCLPPAISTPTSSLAFGSVVKGNQLKKTFKVTGLYLTGSLTVSSSNSNFTVSPTTITVAQAKAGATVTVTYKPSAVGSHSGTITISGGGATSKTVSVSGKCVVPEITVNTTSLLFAGYFDEKTIKVTGTDLTGSLTVSLTGSYFTVSPTTITVAQAKAGKEVIVRCVAPYNVQRATGKITISGGGATSKIVSLSYNANTPVPYAGLILPDDEQGQANNGDDFDVSTMTTAANELSMDVRIYPEGKNIIIESPVEQSAIISDVAGRARRVNLQAGRNEIPINASGIYIVGIREKTAKLMIK